MSGEPVVVLPGEAMVRLVRAAAKVAGARLGNCAIIGGVAVSARLGQAHRATADIDKRAGDAWDMYRILLDLDLDRAGDVRDELSALPAPLPQVVADAAERIFIQRAARTVSWLKAGDERMAAIALEELRALGGLVVDALRSD